MTFKRIILFSILVILITSCKTPEKKNSLENGNSASQFYSFDKTKIAYTDEGSGEAVMLLHGFITDGSSWNQTVLKKSLLDNGYRVIVPDLRGNGNSDKPTDQEAYKNNAEIKDLMALADHLNLKAYIAIGYSRGSIVLAKLLTEENRISKAVLGGMGLDFTDPEWDRRIAFADAFSGRVAPNEMTEGAIEYAKSIDADVQVLGLLQDYQPVTSLKELQNINIATLVICGDRDTDNGNPEALKNQLPNAKLVLVTGNHNDTYKQENFSKVIMDFLSN